MSLFSSENISFVKHLRARLSDYIVNSWLRNVIIFLVGGILVFFQCKKKKKSLVAPKRVKNAEINVRKS